MTTKTNIQEIWKTHDVYSNYQASNLGKVRSIDRYVKSKEGKMQFKKSVVLKPNKSRAGYLMVVLSQDGIRKTITVHQFIAETFLNYKAKKGIIECDHIDGNKTNNKLSNLQILSKINHVIKDKKRGLSKYIGVTKKGKKWASRITIDKKRIYLGTFINEYDAHLAYQKEFKRYFIN